MKEEDELDAYTSSLTHTGHPAESRFLGFAEYTGAQERIADERKKRRSVKG